MKRKQIQSHFTAHPLKTHAPQYPGGDTPIIMEVTRM